VSEMSAKILVNCRQRADRNIDRIILSSFVPWEFQSSSRTWWDAQKLPLWSKQKEVRMERIWRTDRPEKLGRYFWTSNYSIRNTN